MNYKAIFRVVSYALLLEAICMVPGMLLCLMDGEPRVALAYLAAIAVILAVSIPLYWQGKKAPAAFYAQEGFVATSLAWIVLSMLGCLPFVFSGQIPSYVDAVFEMVSGFTTTGASILTDVEAMSRGLLLWRSFSHWLGGMGILVFLLAFTPTQSGGGHTMHLLRAESPGPSVGKLTPRLHQTAKILYILYFSLTVLDLVFLLLGGMPLFDALCTAFGTAGTGGFGVKADSIAGYSPYLQNVTTVFMLLFGINFNLYYFLLLRHFREAFASEEMRVYLGIVAFSTLTITANIASMYDSVGTALRTAFFQVSSIVTTTGYATADFNLWPTYSRIVIVILTFVGACAGSTAGGLKVSRVIILFKAARQDLNKMLHSHAVTTVRFEGKPLDEKTLRGVHNYFNIYMLLLTLSVLLLSLDGFDLVTTFTSVATCLNNVGPGLEMVGPMGSFADFSAPAKLLLAFDMLAGRLELYPMLALFAPRLWRKRINVMHEARAK